MSASREQLMEGIGESLREAFFKWFKRGHQPPMKNLDMTVGQMHCLRTISRLGTPTMSEVATALELQPSTTTGMIDNLVERELVERRDDPDDRRVVRVALTAKGRAGRDGRRKAMRARLMELLGDIDDADLVRIHEALGILRDSAVRKAGAEETTDCGSKEEQG